MKQSKGMKNDIQEKMLLQIVHMRTGDGCDTNKT
jgi:hypothetical protein